MSTFHPPGPGAAQTVPSLAQPRWRKAACVALLIALVSIAAGCGWLLYSDLHSVLSRRAFTYGTLFALAPVAPMVAVFVWVDRLRPEPAHLMVVALVWGALIATYLSLRLNGWLAAEIGDRYVASARSAVFVAPWVEELCKATVIVAIAWWRRHDFNGVVAGVVIGGLAGVGFAFTENIVYYGQVFQHVHDLNNDNGAAMEAVRSLFVWRGLAAPFIHPMFTMMTGMGIGIAVRHRHVGVRVLAPAVGFCMAVLLHMGYNTAASFAVGRGLVAVYVGLLVPTLLVLAVVVALVRRHEVSVIAARLNDYTVYGWLKADHIPYIVTPRLRRRLRRQAGTVGRLERDRIRVLQRTGVDLGVLRDRLVRGVAGGQERRREAELIARLRDLLTRVRLPDGSSAHHGVTPVRSSW